jgi:hypothetical protein
MRQPSNTICAGANERVRSHASEHPAQETAHGRQRGDESRFQNGHVPRLHEIDREPSEEEVREHVDAVLGEIHAHEHAAAQELADDGPVRALAFGARRALMAVHDAAACFDVLEFLAIDARMIGRVLHELDPRAGQQQAGRAHHRINVMPPVGVRHPRHERSEDDGREILG